MERLPQALSSLSCLGTDILHSSCITCYVSPDPFTQSIQNPDHDGSRFMITWCSMARFSVSTKVQQHKRSIFQKVRNFSPTVMWSFSRRPDLNCDSPTGVWQKVCTASFITSHILRTRWQDLLYPLQTVQGSFPFWANIKSGSLLCGLILGESSVLRCEKYVLEILEKLIRYVYEIKILVIIL